MSKVKAVADISRNRLYLTMSGHVDAKTLNALYTDIRFCVADLQPGFIVIDDSSECNLIYLSGLPVYKKIMDYLAANKVGEVVRVVQDTISHKQIINYTDKIQCYKTMYADQIEAAEKKLEATRRRNGIRFKLSGRSIEYTINNQNLSGTLVDLSISGCSVDVEGIVPAMAQELTIVLLFDRDDRHPSHFQIKTRVVRVSTSSFAVQFLDLDDDQQEQLYQRLVYEVSRPVDSP
ncbi:PilZ domain-containing protein [Desulfobulbus alkaliphilus]|uniref:PilZ domain-containing protein n=1 Tax=Desulfobulbus alkaliphilus TaxID=869814 RepID=UPI001964B4A2|nr:PilZ domain-containing protein [Desulfobulbus alkaliphilus]MBM9537812.1 PilZ domain-containing protein [Desulfobulbus alkaliphilus]